MGDAKAPPFFLRPARAEEAGEIRALVRDAYALYVPRMDREPAPMLADYSSLVDAGAVMVAEDSGSILGILVSYQRDHHLHVENVAVASGGQGRGIGRALMAHAEQSARRQNLSAVELYTNEVMTENVPFYTALGYAVTGQTVEEGYKRIYFRKELRD